MHRGRALVPLVATVVLGGTTLAAPASAHSGAGAAFDGAAGPYRVLGYDGAPAPTGEVEFAAVVQDDRSLPADDAQVRVTARRPGAPTGTAVGPVAADRIANVHRYRLPGDGPWEVTLRVTGERGEGTATFTAHAAPGPPTAAPAASAATAPGLQQSLTVAALTAATLSWATLVVVRWRSRRRTAPVTAA